MAPNKTDANDADGLAHLAEVGFYREVRVKGFDSMLTRTLVAARNRLVRITTELSNQIRGLMKTFGVVVPPGKGGSFDANVRRLLEADETGLAAIVWPLLQAWRRRAEPPARRRRTQKPGLPASHVDPRRRHSDGDRLRDRRRRS